MGDGRAPYANRTKACKRQDIKEEPWNVSEVLQNSVVEEQNDSRVETLKAYKCSTISIDQTFRQHFKLIYNNAMCLPKTPMATEQHPATMENLPDEILLEIFTRLLAKQLSQMRSVSKSWNALLSQSSFVKSHLDHFIHYNDQVLLVFDPKVCSCDPKPLTPHPSRSPHLELIEFNKLAPLNPRSGSTNIIRIIGAVNGLICSSNGRSNIYIWNPSLSAVSNLPPYSTPSSGSYVYNLRFGFDPENDDYKVVKLTELPKMEQTSKDITGSSQYILQVEVYSMRKGSWEFTTEWFPSHCTQIEDQDSVCADGHDGRLHWLGHDIRGKVRSKTIVAFNLSLQTFTEIPFPDFIVDHYNRLGRLSGKLCVISCGENGGCKVWVMEEYGVAESWVIRHAFSLFTRTSRPLGLSR